MNADKLNMVAGAAIGSLLVFMLLGFFGGKIFDTRGGHHDHDEPLAFAIEIEEDDTEEVVEETDYAALVASVDIGKGQKLFSKCAACHKVADGANGVGPHLHGVVGRDIASVSDYAFSGALEGIDGNWDLRNLSAFLENPTGWAPGTKMGYSGMKKAEDRVNLIAWLNTQSDAPIELASAPAATATDAADEGATEEAATQEAPAEDAVTEEAEAPAEDASEETAAAEVTDDTDASDVAAATTEASDEVAEATESAVTEVTENVTEEATEIAQDLTETAEAATEEVTETAEEATQEVEAAIESAGEEASAATDEADIVVAAVDATEEATSTDGGAYNALLASADPKQGKKVFRKCRACHKIDEGKNGVGPSLYSIVGQDIAAVDGYSYSDALANKDGAWSLENLMGFLQAPKSWAPGTKMGFAGLKSEEDRIDVITYLNQEASSAPIALE